MQSLAWSTVAILILLLPGFFFSLGVYAPERFARDIVPRNPLATLAATVLIAFVAHVILSWLSAIFWEPVDWVAVLEAIQLPPPTAGAGDSAASRSAARFVEDQGAIAVYVVLSCGLGMFIGYTVGWLAVRGWLPVLVEHPWAYSVKIGNEGLITYAHVLADVAHEGRQLLYRGRLRYFGLAPDGTFSYLVLASAEQRFLRLDRDWPDAGPLRPIGASLSVDTVATPSATEATPWHLRYRNSAPYLRFRRWRQEHAGTSAGPVLVISGSNIKDVVFHGFYVSNLAGEADRAEEAARSVEHATDDRRALEDLERIRGVADSAEQNLPLSRGASPSSAVADIQRMLSALGYEPGPVDGKSGARTARAVRDFQREHGLTVDGVPGPATTARLRVKLNASPHAAKRRSGPPRPS